MGADITQQRTGEGWLYLAVILDAFSRRVMGWSMAEHLRTELVLDALDMAISQRQPAPGLVCHSDHGCQDTAFASGRRLAASELVASMGTVGDALDNAVAERFFATLECGSFIPTSGPPRRFSDGDLRLHRALAPPPRPPLDPRLPSIRRLRTAPPSAASCGLTTLSTEPGHASDQAGGASLQAI